MGEAIDMMHFFLMIKTVFFFFMMNDFFVPKLCLMK
jgi:hypothetical protein